MINPNIEKVIPVELADLRSFHNWTYLINEKKKLVKVPVDSKGFAKGYNDENLLISLEEAFDNACSKGWGIGLTLSDGLSMKLDGVPGYLWCIDFDGFAELNGNHVDIEVADLLSSFNSYTEISPSGTGFKVFLISDKRPTKKLKVFFSTSSFAKDFPEIDKYQNRAVEVFSRNLFLAMTGELYSKNKYNKIRFIKDDELDKLLEKLDTSAKAGGGSGLASNAIQSATNPAVQKSTNRLTKESLDLVLSFIDADDEQSWSDVVNALARLYGQDGRHSFHQYSRNSTKYDEVESDVRYDRALKELSGRPEGYGTKRLLDLARSNPHWTNPLLNNELDNQSQVNIFKEPERNWRHGITASELANKTFNPLMWVVQDILPEGCYLLSARPKVGKSWLSLQVSLAVALGEPTLGKQVTKGKAIYLALEDNERRLKDRLQQLRPNGFNTNDLLLYTQWPSFDDGGIEELVDLIVREEPKLVVIDTLAKVRPASRGNHVYEQDYKALAPLTALASRYRLCILIVTHNRKGKSENDALEQVSGSLGLTGAELS